MKHYKQIFFLSFILIVLGSCSKGKDELTSNTWIAKSLQETKDSQKETPTNTDRKCSISFPSQSEMILTLDANTCQGKIKLEQNKVNVSDSDMPCTLICCDTDFALKLASLFSDVKTYKITGKTLKFKGDNGLELIFKQD